MSEAEAAEWQMTPPQVVERVLQAPFAASDILNALRSNARLRLDPGEVGVIVFPAHGAPFFEVALDPESEVRAAGEAEATYPPMEVRDLGPERDFIYPVLPAEEAEAQKGCA